MEYEPKYWLILLTNGVSLVALWRIFLKAGQPGWAAIVPIYSTVVLARVVRRGIVWAWFATLPFVLAGAVLCHYYYAAALGEPTLGDVSAFGLLCVAGYLGYAALTFSLARAFGKQWDFGCGCVVLPVIFWVWLAFGDAMYQREGPVPTGSSGS